MPPMLLSLYAFSHLPIPLLIVISFDIQKISLNFPYFTVILWIFSVILSIKQAFPSVLRLNMTLGKLIRKIGLDKDNVTQNHKIYAAVFRTPKKSIYGTF